MDHFGFKGTLIQNKQMIALTYMWYIMKNRVCNEDIIRLSVGIALTEDQEVK